MPHRPHIAVPALSRDHCAACLQEAPAQGRGGAEGTGLLRDRLTKPSSWGSAQRCLEGWATGSEPCGPSFETDL